jgi:hypothetical protein
MQLEISRKDAHVLQELLEAYLPELRREVARTEVQSLRHSLVERQNLCERMLSDLSAAGVMQPAGVG